MDSVLDGRLTHYPRRGERTVLPIRVFTGWRGRDLDLRIEQEPDGFAPSQRFLFLGGKSPTGWEWSLEGGLAELPSGQLFQPLLEGMDLTAFDLLTPYLDWTEAEYVKSERVLDSPAHWFRFSPPEEWKTLLPRDGPATVMVALDARFDAPIRVEYLNADGDVIRSLEARSFKKISDTWIVRRLEVVDERTRDRTEWRIDDAVVELVLPLETFTPDGLADTVETTGEAPTLGKG